MQNRAEFYIKLKEQLEATTTFPADYLYKFIVPTTKNQVKEVEDLFKNTKAKIETKASKTGKFISVSVKLKISSADKVIDFYKKAGQIEGIISL